MDSGNRKFTTRTNHEIRGVEKTQSAKSAKYIIYNSCIVVETNKNLVKSEKENNSGMHVPIWKRPGRKTFTGKSIMTSTLYTYTVRRSYSGRF